jgi:hypothetical protein
MRNDLTLSPPPSHIPPSRSAAGLSRQVRDLLDPRPDRRTVTLSGVDDDNGGGGQQAFSVEVACGRYFVSHLVVGSHSSGRRAHPHDFRFAVSDWAGPHSSDWAGFHSSDGAAEQDVRQPPLVVRVVCHCFDIQVSDHTPPSNSLRYPFPNELCAPLI